MIGLILLTIVAFILCLWIFFLGMAYERIDIETGNKDGKKVAVLTAVVAYFLLMIACWFVFI